MGMLFNTDATLKLIEMANSAFNNRGWPNIQAAYATALRKTTNFDTFNDLAKPLNIDHVEPGKSTRWKWWLKNFFDANCAATVYPAIAGYIGNANCTAVEFFAVPTTNSQHYGANVIVVPDSSKESDSGGTGKFTLVVEIQTNTHDALGGP